MGMVDNQSAPAHRPAFCWGCLTHTQVVNAKVHAITTEENANNDGNDNK